MPNVPTDLRKALTANAKVYSLWQGLTPISQRDFVSWVEQAKQEETRKRRIERTPGMLLSGKRRPCCYAVIPMNLYKALSVSRKAKAQWQDLSPDQKRDFSQWVEEPKSPEARAMRVSKACDLLEAGKNHP